MMNIVKEHFCEMRKQFLINSNILKWVSETLKITLYIWNAYVNAVSQ